MQTDIGDTAVGSESLERFGYKQELRRELHRFASYAVPFSFISITTGIFSTYAFALNTGGPRSIWTWPVVAVGQLLVSLVFAAFVSRYPLAGYSYQWASRLTNPKIGWPVGWVSFTFLVIVTVSVDYGLAQVALPALFSYSTSATNIWVVTAIILVIQGGLVGFSTYWSTRINNAAVSTEVIGIVGLAILLVIVGALRGKLNGGSLFSTGIVPSHDYWSPGSAWNAVGPFVLSFLLGAYTIVGFESACNMAEETENPESVVPRSIWMAVAVSGIVGFVFLIALNLTIGDIKAVSGSATPVADIINNVLGSFIGKVFLILVSFSIFACGLVIFMTATRITWAMSRDDRFPGSSLFRQVNAGTNTPLASTALLLVIMEVVLAIFANNSNALVNLFAASTLSPCIIYLFTVLLYVVVRNRLPPSRTFTLGVWEWPVTVLSLVWLVFELSIFRDKSFSEPWKYVGIMFAIGAVYYAYMLITNSKAMEPQSGGRLEVAAGPVSGE